MLRPQRPTQRRRTILPGKLNLPLVNLNGGMWANSLHTDITDIVKILSTDLEVWDLMWSKW